jgi:hypothetical protein
MVLPANYPLLPADTYYFCLIPLNLNNTSNYVNKIFLDFLILIEQLN